MQNERGDHLASVTQYTVVLLFVCTPYSGVSNYHISSLAWVSDGVWYNITFSNAKNEADLSEQQLVKVADSFQ